VEKIPAKKTFTSIVKSLISQALFLSQETLLPICWERHKKSSEVILQSSTQASTLLESCLLKIAQQDIISGQKATHERQYVIIDGLDECEDAEWEPLVNLFQRIIRLLGAQSTRLRILFVSQDTPRIEKALKSGLCLPVTPADIDKDIEIYVRRRMKEIVANFQLAKSELDDVQTEEIVQETCAGAAGKLNCPSTPIH
jgi:hypothetical protein